MSEARVSSALVMISDTSRITGASDARSFSCWMSASKPMSSRGSTSPRICPSADLPAPYRRSSAASSSVGIATSGLHLASGDHLEGADRVRVGRIGHRERELVLVLVQRQRTRFAQEARGYALFENRQFGVARRLDQRQIELRRERLGDVALRDHTERDEQRTELFAGAPAAGASARSNPAASSLPRSIRISPMRFRTGASTCLLRKSWSTMIA